MSNESWNFECLKRGHHIMGILNVTPDSFSDGGKYCDPERAFRRAIEMTDEGASIIDIGGESTRPGSEPVTESLEMDRIIPLIERISREIGVVISVDTCKSVVAREAVKAGARIINDISGLTFDPNMIPAAAELNVPVVIMHIKGTPKNMQVSPQYGNVVAEVSERLRKQAEKARSAGIREIIVDPGFGFGKRLEDNFQLLKHLDQFRFPDCPLLVGTSRKSFLGSLFGLPPDQRMEGTLATNIWALLQGATIFRVHDVSAVNRALLITRAITEAS